MKTSFIVELINGELSRKFKELASESEQIHCQGKVAVIDLSRMVIINTVRKNDVAKTIKYLEKIWDDVSVDCDGDITVSDL